MTTILLVDDDRIQIEYVEHLLIESGYKVLLADNGVKAINLLRTNQEIDIIVSDMQMPPGEWGGLWLIEQVKSYLSTPVIILSERGTVSKAVEAIKSGAVDYVEKTNLEDELIAAIEKTMFDMAIRPTKEKVVGVSNYYHTLQNTFGLTWGGLSSETQTFIANSEHIYHAHSHDVNFDFSVGIIELSKAIETECNNKIVPMITQYFRDNTVSPPCFKINNREVEADKLPNTLTIGQIFFILRNSEVAKIFKSRGDSVNTLQKLIDCLDNLRIKYRRNDAAHSQLIELGTYERLRTEILGIGSVSPLKLIQDLSVKEN